MKNVVIYISIVLVVVSGVFYLSVKPGPKIMDENHEEMSAVQMTTVEEKNKVNTTNHTPTAPTPTGTGTNQNTLAETPTPKTHEINIISFAYNPKTLTINKGDTVVWTNNDSAPHDVVGTDYTKLRSIVMSKGEKFSFTFNDVGTFNYLCSIHPMMKASIIVK